MEKIHFHIFMETFVNICRAASDDTLSKLDSHLEALMEILDPRFTSHRFHCFTYLALHTMEAIVSDEIIRRNNERQMARQMADAYIEMEQHASEDGGGGSSLTTSPIDTHRPIFS